MPRRPAEYSAEDIQVLEGLDAVRKRPGMYIGSTDARGLQHCLWEIIDNAVDEALAGYCNHIIVTLHSDRSAEVSDNGRGIPVDTNTKTGMSGVEMVFTKLHAGGKFGGGGYEVSGGLHGVGASVVNALSSRLDVEVDRDGVTYAMSFHRGDPGVFDSAGKFKKRSGIVVVPGKPKVSGTRVRYWADREIFLADADIDLALTHDRARQTAFLVPGLTIVVVDDRTGDAVTETFHFDGGALDFVEFLAPDPPLAPPIVIQGTGKFTETVPVLDEQVGHMVSKDVERTISVDIAVRWGTGYDTHVKSFVNIIATPKGGTHVAGFERALTKSLAEAATAMKALKANEDNPVKDDVLEGLTAVVCVRLAEPQFEGQTKEILGTPAATKIVADVVGEVLASYFMAKANKLPARKIVDKVVAAARVRRDLRLKKETARRKTALESSSMPPKLADCRSDDLERNEIMIVEGDSAMGTAKTARNAEFQALLPIRGKILNTMRASERQMLDNVECAAIITVMGGGSGRSFDVSAIRYGKLITMSVTGETPVLVMRGGHLVLSPIGPLIDTWLSEGNDTPDASTVALDAPSTTVAVAPLKKVIRHRYQGVLRHLTTATGRQLSVTAGHSVFTYENETITLRLASELEVGSLIVAPRTIPRPSTYVTEITLPATASREPAASVPVSEDLAELLGWCSALVTPGQLPDAVDLMLLSPRLRDLLATVTPPLPHDPTGDQRHREATRLLERILDAVGRFGSDPLAAVLNFAPEAQWTFLRGFVHAVAETDKGTLVLPVMSKNQALHLAYLLAQWGIIATNTGDEAYLRLTRPTDVSVLRPLWKGLAASGDLEAFCRRSDSSGVVPIAENLVGLPLVAVEDEAVDAAVYDFSVERCESFVAGTGGGVMAHNTDADVDGAHIRTLLLTLCFKYMRPLLEEGHVYAAVPPLHRITISGSGEHIYTYTDEEYQRTIADLDKSGKKVKDTQRYKGLGEMDADQLAETTLDPARRLLRRITMDDAAAAAEMFEVLMGQAVPPRREYIVDNALTVSPDRIDA
jgi:DNA gyrase subunit B